MLPQDVSYVSFSKHDYRERRYYPAPSPRQNICQCFRAVDRKRNFPFLRDILLLRITGVVADSFLQFLVMRPVITAKLWVNQTNYAIHEKNRRRQKSQDNRNIFEKSVTFNTVFRVQSKQDDECCKAAAYHHPQ